MARWPRMLLRRDRWVRLAKISMALARQRCRDSCRRMDDKRLSPVLRIRMDDCDPAGDAGSWGFRRIDDEEFFAAGDPETMSDYRIHGATGEWEVVIGLEVHA